MAFDDMILEPVAKGYNKLPEQIKRNWKFYLKYLNFSVYTKHFVAGNFKQFGHATGSVIVNTSIGILGLFNPAENSVLNHKEDVGQTLATYGIGSGCYFVLPILGPTTVRPLGLLADTYIDPFAHITIREKNCLEFWK